MTSAARRRAFAALYRLGRGLESATSALHHAAAGLLDRATLQAAITEEWRQFGIAQDAVDDAALFAWEETLYSRFIERADRILLIGCGTGRDLITLLGRGYRVEGLDLVAESVARARQRLADRKLDALVRVGDIETIELPEHYDVFVFSWYCYAYIPESARRVRVLEKLAARLAPGGRILLSYVPARQPGPSRALRVARAVAQLTRTDWRPEAGDSLVVAGHSMSSVTFQHFFRTGEAEAEARVAGLRVLAHEASGQTMTMALAGPF